LKFSIKTFALLIAWSAMIMSALTQIRSEVTVATVVAPSGIAADSICVVNLLFALFSLSNAVGSDQRRRRYWITATAIAFALLAIQLLDIFPRRAAETCARQIVEWLTTSRNGYVAMHCEELATIMLYCWSPVVALIGAEITQSRIRGFQNEIGG
jgi:hypothetical protein